MRQPAAKPGQQKSKGGDDSKGSAGKKGTTFQFKDKRSGAESQREVKAMVQNSLQLRQADAMRQQVDKHFSGLTASPASAAGTGGSGQGVVQRLKTTVKGVPVDLKEANFTDIAAIEALCKSVGINHEEIKANLYKEPFMTALQGDPERQQYWYRVNLLNRLAVGVGRNTPNYHIATQALSQLLDGISVNWEDADNLAATLQAVRDPVRLTRINLGSLPAAQRKRIALQAAQMEAAVDKLMDDTGQTISKKLQLMTAMVPKAHALVESAGVTAGADTGAAVTGALKKEDAIRQKIYFSNAPSDDYRSGDGSYMNEMVDWINQNDKTRRATRVFDSDKMDKEKLPLGPAMTPVPYMEQTAGADKEAGRARGEKAIIDHLIEEAKLHPNAQHVFHLQLRFPDSGQLFSREGLLRIKQAGFSIVGTVHEMKLNRKSTEWMQRTLVQMNEYIPLCDKVIFLNDHDKSFALKLRDAGSVTEYLRRRNLRRAGRKGDDVLADLSGYAGAVGSASETSRSGRVGNAVDTMGNFDLHRRSTVMPVFPTVPGKPQHDPQDILRRQKNLLVFGLIRNNTAITNTVGLAKEISKSPVLAGSQVLVVGKVLTGTLEAFKILMDETFRMNKAESKAMKAEIDALAATSSSENDFNTKLQAYIEVQTKMKMELWAKTKAELEKVTAEFEKLQAAVKELEAQESALKREAAAKEKAAKLAASSQPLPVAISQDPPAVGSKPPPAVDPAMAELSARLRAARDAVKPTKRLKASKEEELLRHTILPIQVHLNVSSERLSELALQCKYAYKDDEKGMADNASSIISALAQGCLVFTRAGFDTPNAFRTDKGGMDSPVIMPGEKYAPATPEFVAAEMTRRESPEDGQATNTRTIDNMNKALATRYNLHKVGRQHLAIYDEVGGFSGAPAVLPDLSGGGSKGSQQPPPGGHTGSGGSGGKGAMGSGNSSRQGSSHQGGSGGQGAVDALVHAASLIAPTYPPGTRVRFRYMNGKPNVDVEAVVLNVAGARAHPLWGQLSPAILPGDATTALVRHSAWVLPTDRSTTIVPHVVVRAVKMLNAATLAEIQPAPPDIPNVIGDIFPLLPRNMTII